MYESENPILCLRNYLKLDVTTILNISEFSTSRMKGAYLSRGSRASSSKKPNSTTVSQSRVESSTIKESDIAMSQSRVSREHHYE
jgi:hypothetical protein